MYQISCDNFTLFDPRDPEMMLLNPKCKLQTNTVGEGSFTILANHPNYAQLQRLRSIFEFRQDDRIIFRGRMTSDSKDFYNQLDVDLEGILAYTNDSIIPPFNYPNDFPEAESAENTVEYFLQWLVAQHNAQVQPWQQLNVGIVTVNDANNYISRSSENYASTWETLKTKLFESSLGGNLYARYEEDGTYIDYVAEFSDTNSQHITITENLLDILRETDASETYSAILPLGNQNENGVRLTIENLPDGDLNEDLVKQGKFIYSRSAREQYGWICVPVEQSTWDDVTEAQNLQNNAAAYLSGTAMLFQSTTTIKGVDLYFSDQQLESIEPYKNIIVDSPPHDMVNASYPLPQLEIDLLNPQNTLITIGSTVRTLIDINNNKQSSAADVVQKFADKTNQTSHETQVQLSYLTGQTNDLGESVLVLENELADLQVDLALAQGNILDLNADVTDLQDFHADSHKNMLHNWDFCRLINQRGEAVYQVKNEYGVDRWILNTEGSNLMKLTLGTGGEGSEWRGRTIMQKLEYLPAGTYTLSVEACATATAHSMTMGFSLNDVIETGANQQVTTEKQILSWTITVAEDYADGTAAFVLKNNAATYPIIIYRVKLERGSVSTLAMDGAADPAEQMQLCRRFYQNLTGALAVSGSDVMLSLSPPMRAAPTVSMTTVSGEPTAESNEYAVRISGAEAFSCSDVVANAEL